MRKGCRVCRGAFRYPCCHLPDMLLLAVACLLSCCPLPALGQFRFGCDGFCAARPCPELDCARGRLARNATKCGCCDVCVEHLREGEPCETKIAGFLPREECGPQLTCDKRTSRCVPVDTPCLREQELRRRQNVPVMKTVATCDEFGFYDPVVCISNVLCYCVDKDGKRIFGTDVASEKDQMHCNCSRDFDSFPRRVPDGDFLRCLPCGNYDLLQCTEEWCYCLQDRHAGYGQSQDANESLQNLACYDVTRHGGQDSSLLRECWRERGAAEKTLREYRGRDTTVVGLDMPECQLDGTYAPVQCSKNECYCVNEKGKIFDQYRVLRNSEEARKMNCYCARDKDLIRKVKKKNANTELFMQDDCLPNGNYMKI